VAIFVVAALIASALVARLLRPLDDISRRMYLAASFEDGNEEAMESFISEIHALQDSYKAMNKQLNRIKSFVPQSVLAELQGDLSAADEMALEERAFLESMDASNHASLTEMPPLDDRRKSTTSLHSARSARKQNDDDDDLADHRSAAPKYATAAKSLGSELTLAAVNMTVLAINQRSVHGLLRSYSVDEFVKHMAKMVSLVEKEVGDHRGVVDNFHGDHFYCSFNAVRPCANHGQRAASTGIRIVTAAAESLDVVLTAGLAMGRAHVGNLGSAGMKRFNAIGPVYTQATVLERLCKLYTPAVQAEGAKPVYAQVMTHAAAISDAEHAPGVVLQVVDEVLLPGSGQPQRVAVVRETAKVAHLKPKDEATPGEPVDNEWLYLVDAGRNANPFRGLNAAFAALASGKLDEAREAFTQYTHSVQSDPIDIVAREKFAALLASRPADSAGIACPEYYSRCIVNMKMVV